MPAKRIYEKKEAFRSASLFLIVCEGIKREPAYFEFFNGLSSRIKIKLVPCEDGRSSPNHLFTKAEGEAIKYDFVEGDEVWFVVDTDQWEVHIHSLRTQCAEKSNWNVAQSNPCFEVWLYFHFKDKLPDDGDLKNSAYWKNKIPNIISGGFKSDIHPLNLEDAIKNAELNYVATGYSPNVGSTQVFMLAKKILPFIKNDLKKIIDQLANK